MINLNSDQIRETLIQRHIIPTPDKARETFWSLGENWWKQIIDGDVHQHGKWVFDKGLHGDDREQGFLEGITKASHYFSNRFHMDFTQELYGEIHHVACRHFKGARNNTLFTQEEIDHKRTYKTPECVFEDYSKKFKTLKSFKIAISNTINSIIDQNPSLDQSCGIFTCCRKTIDDKHIRKLVCYTPKEYKDVCRSLRKKDEITVYKKLQTLRTEISNTLQNLANVRVEKINQAIANTSKRLGVKQPFAQCVTRTDDFIGLIYLEKESQSECKQIEKKLIKEFNENLEEAQRDIFAQLDQKTEDENKLAYQRKVKPLISRLFAELEWLHPWIDGQGRTDLITLSGLLCREGLHPAILVDPYYSSLHTLEKWERYLDKGLKRFEETNEF